MSREQLFNTRLVSSQLRTSNIIPGVLYQKKSNGAILTRYPLHAMGVDRLLQGAEYSYGC